MTADLATTKTCTLCHRELPIEEFPVVKRRALRAPSSWCRPCIRAKKAEHYAANREREREKRRAWYRDNREAHHAAHRKWVAEHREEWAAYQAGYKPGWVAANPERVREINRAADARRYARKRAGHVEDVDRHQVFRDYDGCCGICGAPVDPDDFHIDHVVPLSRGGEHSYANTQLAHPGCNQRKASLDAPHRKAAV